MSPSTDTRALGYLIVVAGVILAAVSAVVPFYTAGHQLRFGVLMAGVLPYAFYAIAVVLMPQRVTWAAGSILLLAHLGLVVEWRFRGGADYSDGVIYLAPLLFVLLLLPLVVRALTRPWQ